MKNELMNRVIFFDGHCVACNKMVDFITDRAPVGFFRFASLQSDIAKTSLVGYGYPLKSIQNLDNIVYLRFGKLKTKSDAVLSIAVDIGGAYKILTLLYAIPKWVRNRIYDAFARRRYRWFGKNETCRMPTTDENFCLCATRISN